MKHFLGILLLLGLTRAIAAPLPLITIQPLGKVGAEDLREVKAGINARYAVEVEILAAQPLPKAAYYAPRDRYKAGDILDILTRDAPANFSKVIAITARDISATTDTHEDWGIMGMGRFGGRACIVSTFRLHKGDASPALFFARLVKVASHELGHTFGLDHCPTAGCLMQDKHGKISSVDAESGAPCAECAKRLPLRK